MKIRLEYNPALGKFNHVPSHQLGKKTPGYETLCCYIDSHRVERFQNAVIETFPVLREPPPAPYPSVELIKIELLKFLAELIYDEQRVATLAKDRVTKFNNK